MKLVTFIENKYQELTLANKSNPYYVHRDSEIKALHALLHAYRTLLKWLYIPKCLFEYFGACCGFYDEPQPVLVNQAREQKEKEEEEKQKAIEQNKIGAALALEKKKAEEEAKVCHPFKPRKLLSLEDKA